MGCSTSIAKLLLIVFNVLFFLFGLGSIIAGVFVLVSRDNVLKLIDIATKSASADDKAAVANYFDSVPLINMAAVILIVIGSLTFVIGFCGCCGALKQSNCLLMTYAICIGIVLTVEIAGAIVAIVFQSRVRNEAGKHLINLQNKYFVSYKSYLAHSKNSSRVEDKMTLLLNYAQVFLQCCGVEKRNDIANSTSWKSSDNTYKLQKMITPMTCCELKDQTTRDSLIKNAEWNNFFQSPANYLKNENCPISTTWEGVYPTSCFDKMESMINKHAVIIIAVGLSIGLIEILGIVFACCLMKSYNDN